MKNNQNSSFIPTDLLDAQKLVYTPLGFLCEKFEEAAESKDYGACTFELNNYRVQFRIAKITPMKIGQFVTLWKRIGKGPILPYDISDPVDLFIISVRDFQRFGQFVFSKEVLREKGIVSIKSKSGKLGIRVYPSWGIPNNKQAEKTQSWQIKYFFGIKPDGCIDAEKVQELFQ